jgi:hypothetical protein
VAREGGRPDAEVLAAPGEVATYVRLVFRQRSLNFSVDTEAVFTIDCGACQYAGKTLR